MVDLFAGCGGLSLGLEQAGFSPLLFSEISPSAAATYKANRPDSGVVHVPDVATLTTHRLQELVDGWRAAGIRDIDLVAGGPPCQGYSGIGHRRTFGHLQKRDIPSNHLFVEMARIIRLLRPKLFLFENVKGLASARWSAGGRRGEVFRDVLKEFAGIDGYAVRWQLVHAGDYGVPQRRPRVFIVGIREDIVASCRCLRNIGKLAILDDSTAVRDGFLPPPMGLPPSIEELLSDIEDSSYPKSSFSPHYLRPPLNDLQRELRTRPDGKVLGDGDPLTEHEHKGDRAALGGHSGLGRRRWRRVTIAIAFVLGYLEATNSGPRTPMAKQLLSFWQPPVAKRKGTR